MTDPLAPNTQLLLPARNSYQNTWDVPNNANFAAIDAMLGGTTTVSLSNQNVSLSVSQSQAANVVLTGNITSNILVLLPAGFSKIYSVLNGTVGTGQVVYFGTATGGASLYLPQGRRIMAVSDGSNVYEASQSIPPGAALPWLAPTVPGGFIFPWGQVLPQSSYPGIYAAYGSTYNTGGEGAGNFRMPDLRGVTLAGLDNMGGTARGLLTAFGSNGQQLGAVGGEQLHTLSVPEMPNHGHGLNDPGHSHSTTEVPHTHPYAQTNNSNTGAANGTGANQGTFNAQTGQASTGLTVNSSTTGISIQPTGGGNPHNNVQPTLLCNWIVKT